MAKTFDCYPLYDLCDDVPCHGHEVTRDIDLVARVLAVKDGWDSLEDSEQVEDYHRDAAGLITAIQEAGR